MREVVFTVPGDLATPTGGYAYTRRLLAHLPEEGIAVRYLALPAGYPDPSPAELAETLDRIRETPPDAVLLVDGLAFGAMPADLVARFSRPIVALVHHPLGFENGLSAMRREALLASERAALALARAVIVTSPLTGRLLVDEFAVAANRITIAEPGTEPARRARGTGSPVQLLALGAVSPRKAYDHLILALATMPDLDWQATIAGPLDRAPETVAGLRDLIAKTGLEDRVILAGAVSGVALDGLFDAADVFVSSSLFEGYGMGLAEALARGLPLVASIGGAALETVPDAAALKVSPGDTEALALALRRIIVDRGLRVHLGDAAWAAGQRLPRWSDTARTIARVLHEVS
ncbi:glycosyltransferase family 4 protein [Microvirga massiliensis]|uniref:glycosyltransferase family 4 protein n=1 Tax=Microvirga massiliensis TaxID=1033741 RepID=UPI00062B4C03|nr:glycosyltransferase family 4 protein [Microvirga massiliensis]